MNVVYTIEQKEFVRTNRDIKDKDLHLMFNQTFNVDIKFAAFRKFRQRLGVTKPQGRPNGKT